MNNGELGLIAAAEAAVVSELAEPVAAGYAPRWAGVLPLLAAGREALIRREVDGRRWGAVVPTPTAPAPLPAEAEVTDVLRHLVAEWNEALKPEWEERDSESCSPTSFRELEALRRHLQGVEVKWRGEMVPALTPTRFALVLRFGARVFLRERPAEAGSDEALLRRLAAE